MYIPKYVRTIAAAIKPKKVPYLYLPTPVYDFYFRKKINLLVKRKSLVEVIIHTYLNTISK